MLETTPLMKQYLSIKERHSDAILLFRLGDFYEMFGEDAKVASKILQIALTTRDKTKEDPVPMCGIPYFAAESYISRLIKAGHKVAVCEQMEDAKEAKGIVQRDVIKVITPGTHTPENPKENNYIFCFFPAGKKHGIALADISTGEFSVYETEQPVEDELSRFEPKELLYPASLKDNLHYAEILKNFYTSAAEDWSFDFSEAYRVLLKHFRVSSLESYGCEGMTAAISAAGALISYVENTLKESVPFKKISPLMQSSYMFLDAATQRNLELVHNLRGGTEGTLLSVMDETLTPMGGRYLRNAILRPLIDITDIQNRQGAVDSLVDDYEVIETLRNNLRRVQDLERLASRVSAGTANPRDLVAVKNSIAYLPAIKSALHASPNHYLKTLGEEIGDLSSLKAVIESGIVESPPISVRDGGIIRDGYNTEVDKLRKISTSGKDFVAELETKERQKSGIASLKVGYNKIYGYYIEITKANLDLVPDHYIRKQTLVNGERFITPELKEYESKIIGSEEHLKNLEHSLFQTILGKVQAENQRLTAVAHAIAKADFLTSLAILARRHAYVKPIVDGGTAIEITDGRHPVLERLTSEQFIPNSASVSGENDRLLIITGPNMAGKSTFMRQTAIIVLMAQLGSFVPAAEAKIGLVDRIFTRIGASDFISKGQSTFMVEMIEAANILNNASARSLIILDEIGRGTSTFDGISIAWAVAEYILTKIQARTLFATHYNELTELSMALDGVKNYNISVKEWGDDIIFLRKITPGPADKSYGIQVGRLAGLPEDVIDRAKEVLASFESNEMTKSGKTRFVLRDFSKRLAQMDLFESTEEPLLSELLHIDVSKLTPKAALAKLRELRKAAESLSS
ncbi:MAG TPA: DNA mismatch repair protein MutS [Nitrospiraceae bacterium]|jgi:DNA mismatch repair protein MutS|nr:DNA mismatch repair protein MutS [Nitrospiraceae bacterium]